MICNDAILSELLDASANGIEVSTAEMESDLAAHIEHCPRCQRRLFELSGGGEWSERTRQSLSELPTIGMRPSGSASATLSRTHKDVEQRSCVSSILVSVDPSLADDVVGACEPIALDFLNPPSHPEMLGRLGRYEIEGVIGAGGMGIVLKGFDTELHRPVAIKVLAPHLAGSGAARSRFAREAQAAAAIVHDQVMPIHNVEWNGKLPFLVMPFICGRSLQARIDETGPLPIRDILRIAMQSRIWSGCGTLARYRAPRRQACKHLVRRRCGASSHLGFRAGSSR